MHDVPDLTEFSGHLTQAELSPFGTMLFVHAMHAELLEFGTRELMHVSHAEWSLLGIVLPVHATHSLSTATELPVHCMQAELSFMVTLSISAHTTHAARAVLGASLPVHGTQAELSPFGTVLPVHATHVPPDSIVFIAH